MKSLNFITSLMVTLFFICVAGNANATILNFDDSEYANGNGIQHTAFQGQYGGLDWSSQFGIYYEPNVYKRGATSGDYALFNRYGDPVEITIAAGSTFDWNGAWFTSGRVSGSLNISGYYNGSEIYTGTIALANPDATWFQANWSGVDKISFHAIHNKDITRFLMDDFIINEYIPTPIPGALLLFASGLIGFVGLRRKNN
jgi:hypothetical protein